MPLESTQAVFIATLFLHGMLLQIVMQEMLRNPAKHDFY